jgi:hypothetical protein
MLFTLIGIGCWLIGVNFVRLAIEHFDESEIKARIDLMNAALEETLANRNR